MNLSEIGVLVVKDFKPVRSLVELYLKKPGIKKVYHAVDGRYALETPDEKKLK